MHNQFYRNPSLKKISSEYDETRQLFSRVKNNWNLLIRNFLSKNMGVSLTDGDYRHQIQIEILPAFSEEFMQLIERNFPDLDFQEYFVLNRFMEQSFQAQPYIKDDNASFHLQQTIKHTKSILQGFNLKDLTESIFQFLNPRYPDVFGCYFIGETKVEIYIFPIVLFSQLHGLDLESLIVKVLTHELAHAYNHIGRDKDGKYWKLFAKTDSYIAEGLAQYYTYNFLRHYQYKHYKLLETFEKTLKFQPDPYQVFKEWDTSMEEIYGAFIETRRNNYNKYAQFLEVLNGSKGRISDRKSELNYSKI